MATATRKCKVCGIEYEYCHTLKHIAGVFRWQDVACSPEHGSIYLSKIRASRAKQSDNTVVVENNPEVVSEPLSIDDFMDDEEEYDDEDSEDEED